MKFRVCGIQITAKPLKIEENLQKMIQWAEKAKAELNPQLIVFPESITTSFSPGISKEEFLSVVEEVPGRSTEVIAELCKRLDVDILLPMYEKQGDTIYNDSIYIDHKGEILGIYRKTHLFPTEHTDNGGWSTPGNDIVTVDTRFGRMGMIICYDGDFPELSRILALRGAKAILRPSALLRSCEIWELTNKARAYDNHVHVIAVNAVGSDGADCLYFGHSMVISPNAQKLALARGCEEIIYADIDLDGPDPVSYGTNNERIFDHIKTRNLNAYTDELLK
jgi:predicted amidohydrolase